VAIANGRPAEFGPDHALRRHLEQVLRIHVQHYSSERPQRGLALRSPEPPSLKRSSGGDVQRCDRLGGLPHEYYRATV
jgi:putative transposase